MSYRALRDWFAGDVLRLAPDALDMPVVLRVEDEEGEHHVGGLYDVGVEDDHCDVDALVLDAALDVFEVDDATPVAIDDVAFSLNPIRVALCASRTGTRRSSSSCAPWSRAVRPWRPTRSSRTPRRPRSA